MHGILQFATIPIDLSQFNRMTIDLYPVIVRVSNETHTNTNKIEKRFERGFFFQFGLGSFFSWFGLVALFHSIEKEILSRCICLYLTNQIHSGQDELLWSGHMENRESMGSIAKAMAGNWIVCKLCIRYAHDRNTHSNGKYRLFSLLSLSFSLSVTLPLVASGQINITKSQNKCTQFMNMWF